jgi:hypothetical protein
VVELVLEYEKRKNKGSREVQGVSFNKNKLITKLVFKSIGIIPQIDILMKYQRRIRSRSKRSVRFILMFLFDKGKSVKTEEEYFGY